MLKIIIINDIIIINCLKIPDDFFKILILISSIKKISAETLHRNPHKLLLRGIIFNKNS